MAAHRVLRAQRRALFQQERLALVVSTSAASPYTGPVLVTGAGGFIGRALCARLAAAQIPYVGAVRVLAPGETESRGIVALGDFAADDSVKPGSAL